MQAAGDDVGTAWREPMLQGSRKDLAGVVFVEHVSLHQLNLHAVVLGDHQHHLDAIKLDDVPAVVSLRELQFEFESRATRTGIVAGPAMQGAIRLISPQAAAATKLQFVADNLPASASIAAQHRR